MAGDCIGGTMGDTYKEILVKRKSRPTDGLIRIGLIALTVLCAAAGLFVHILMLIPAIGLGVACYFLLPSFDLEYEYLYVNGDIDVDKIMSRQKRKKAASFDLAELEICAPTGSHELDSYLSGGNAKIADYTSGEENVKFWTVICNHNGERTGAMLELDETVIGDLWRRAPRKVIKY